MFKNIKLFLFYRKKIYYICNDVGKDKFYIFFSKYVLFFIFISRWIIIFSSCNNV